MKNIQDLPIELINEILSYCKYDILVFSQTNKTFNASKIEYLTNLFISHRMAVDTVCSLRTYIHILKYKLDVYEIFELFRYNKKQSKYKRFRKQNTILQKAIRNNHYVIIKLLTKTLLNTTLKYYQVFNWAISTNHIDIVVFILKNKTFKGKDGIQCKEMFDLTIKDCKPLRLAVLHSRVAIARILIEYKPKILRVTSIPFENAIKQNDKEMIKLFLNHKAQISVKYNGIWHLDPVLSWSMQNNNCLDILELVITHGVDIHKSQELPFYKCITYGNLNACKVLKSHGCYLHQIRYKDIIELCMSKENTYDYEFIEFIISCMDFKIHFELIAKIFLNIVIYQGHIKLATEFIKQCKRLVDVNDNKALQICADLNHHELMRILIDNGANIHANRSAAICLASYKSNIKVMKILLKAGIDIHTNNDEALRFACQDGYYDVVRLLVENGANIHANDDEAVGWAAGFGHVDIVKYLIIHGAFIYANTHYAYRLAVEKNQTEILKYFAESKIYLNIT